MIYIVDEDIVQMSSLKTEFEFRGYEVKMISNADDAWDIIPGESNLDLVIIDIMLAAKPPQESRYKSDKTRSYTITGICLAEDFLEQYNEMFKNKIVYLSHTNENGILSTIEKSVTKNNIAFFRKHEYPSDMTLAEDILNNLNLPLEI